MLGLAPKVTAGEEVTEIRKSQPTLSSSLARLRGSRGRPSSLSPPSPSSGSRRPPGCTCRRPGGSAGLGVPLARAGRGGSWLPGVRGRGGGSIAVPPTHPPGSSPAPGRLVATAGAGTRLWGSSCCAPRWPGAGTVTSPPLKSCFLGEVGNSFVPKSKRDNISWIPPQHPHNGRFLPSPRTVPINDLTFRPFEDSTSSASIAFCVISG